MPERKSEASSGRLVSGWILNFADKLKLEEQRLGLPRKAFLAIFPMSGPSYYMLMRGEGNPTLGTLLIVAQRLNWSEEDLKEVFCTRYISLCDDPDGDGEEEKTKLKQPRRTFLEKKMKSNWETDQTTA